MQPTDGLEFGIDVGKELGDLEMRKSKVMQSFGKKAANNANGENICKNTTYLVIVDIVR